MVEKQIRYGPFGSNSPVEVASLLDMSDKIREASYFLVFMEKETDIDKFRWLTSAFLGACRSALDWLAWNACHAKQDPKGYGPDERVIEGLKAYCQIQWLPKRKKAFAKPTHPLLIQMSAIRQEVAHRSANWIDKLPAIRGEVLQCSGEEFAFVWVTPEPNRNYLWRTVPQGRVVPFCRLAIRLIEEIHLEAHRLAGFQLPVRTQSSS